MIKDLGRVFISAVVSGMGIFAGTKIAQNLYENGTIDKLGTKIKNSLSKNKSGEQRV